MFQDQQDILFLLLFFIYVSVEKGSIFARAHFKLSIILHMLEIEYHEVFLKM